MIQIVAGRKGFVYTNPKIVCESVQDALSKTEELLSVLPESERFNLFFTLAHHHGAQSATTPPRTHNTFDYQTVLSWDIDYCDTTKPYDYLDIMAEVLQLHRDAFSMVCSGNGFQFHLNLQYPIRNKEFFPANKPYYNATLDKIQQRLNDLGLPGKPDPVIWEAARVMRLPCTRNTKDGVTKIATRIQVSNIVVDLDIKKIANIGDIEKDNVSPKDIRRHYPKPDFQEIYKECQFIQWCAANPTLIHEPHAFDLFSLLGNMPAGVKIVHEDIEKDARDFAKWIFDNATSSKSLRSSKFDEKLDQSRKYGCRKCETINSRWEVGCQSCPHFGKIATPLALKSADHIGSEDNGYWVMNSKGDRKHPHYGDLAKIFSRETTFIATPDERIMIFTGAKYEEMEPLRIKGWAERKITPTDELRDLHRNEFHKKLLATGVVSRDSLDELFETSTLGKLNCKNGVLDIVTGELLPHSPHYGFKYVLPYDYVPDETSEYFIDWLEVISCYREDVFNSLLDVMAYALWPKYDDHMFTVFSGDGRNGKSTIIKTLRNIVGPENFSSVNMSQLAQNRFAPAELEGKLVNLCEEVGAGTLDSSEVDTLKNLSSGGTMLIERKGRQGYSMTNKAKLIFAANNPPKLPDHDLALRRRLLVVPFDHIIQNEDASIGYRIENVEAPKILSMLVRRIKDNVIQNKGSFKVYRGGHETKEAQKRMLTHNNTAVNFAKEMIESSLDLHETTFITTDDAYDMYRQWCTANGFTTPFNKIAFCQNFMRYVASPGTELKVKRMGMHDLKKIFTRTRFKQGVETDA